MYDFKKTSNLKKIRIEKNILQKELCENLGINQSAYSHIERNIYNANVKTILKIANYFNVSTDFLLGLKDIEEENKIKNENRKIVNLRITTDDKAILNLDEEDKKEWEKAIENLVLKAIDKYEKRKNK